MEEEGEGDGRDALSSNPSPSITSIPHYPSHGAHLVVLLEDLAEAFLVDLEGGFLERKKEEETEKCEGEEGARGGECVERKR